VADDETLSDLLSRSASLYPDSSALVSARAWNDEAFTFLELRNTARAGAACLVGRGLQPGDRVLLLMESRPAWGAAFFAILEAGLVAVPAPMDTPVEALRAMIAHVRPAAVVHGERTQALAADLAPLPALSTAELFTAGTPGAAAPRTTELAVLAFTSGSTSNPRAVELTHANILADLDALLRARCPNPGDAFLSMLPPAHLFELVGGLLSPLASGARVVYPGTLMPNRIVAAVREEEITHAMAVPALVRALYEEIIDELADAGVVQATARELTVQESAARLEAFDAPELQRRRAGLRERIGRSFRYLVVGGASLDPVWARLLPPLGVRLEYGYGLTEAGPVVSVGYANESPPGSVGRPLPGVEVRIDDGGEILVRGLNVMRGYFEDPEATRQALTGGWLRTGDCGRLSADGFLFVTGRVKEAMVTAAGETIYPDEVEPYYESALFRELCVAPLVGPDGNDRPILFVFADAASDEELDAAFAELRASAPPRCRVERMIRVPAPLPRTAAGKVRRRYLAQARGLPEVARGDPR